MSLEHLDAKAQEILQLYEYPKAATYADYRQMLDRESDIEAVIIATLDHTHAVILVTNSIEDLRGDRRDTGSRSGKGRGRQGRSHAPGAQGGVRGDPVGHLERRVHVDCFNHRVTRERVAG